MQFLASILWSLSKMPGPTEDNGALGTKKGVSNVLISSATMERVDTTVEAGCKSFKMMIFKCEPLAMNEECDDKAGRP
jgi:hypothetical protein